MSDPQYDIINILAGIKPGSRYASLRESRPETTSVATDLHVTLFEIDDDAIGLDAITRQAVGLRIGVLERYEPYIKICSGRLSELGADEATIAAIKSGPDAVEDALLRAIIAHTDLLTTASRDGSAAAIDALRAAGLSESGIVTLSQLIAFCSYQIRMATTMSAIAGGAR